MFGHTVSNTGSERHHGSEVPIELPADYYHTNFWRLIDGVLDRYADLLSVAEATLIDTLRSLPKSAQLLYLRFLTRKGCWFRLDKLDYPEISDLPLALQQLAEVGLVLLPQQAEWEVLGQLCTKAELCQMEPSADRRLRKAELLQWLYLQPLPVLPFQLIEVVDQDSLSVFCLLYFGNPHQSLSEFVITDLGHVHYESYPLDRTTRIYQNRQQIELHLRLTELRNGLYELPKNGDWQIDEYLQKIPAAVGHRSLDYRRQLLIEYLARELERRSELETARVLFETCDSSFSRERRCRILVIQEEFEAALELLGQILASPSDQGELEFARGFEHRLRRKLKHKVIRPPVFEPESLTLRLPPWSNGVEATVLEDFQQHGWSGSHSENSLITGVFGLAFWPAIFADIPGAFFHPFQRGPADLYRRGFVVERKSLLNSLLQQVEQQDWMQVLHQRYREKRGIANPFVDWRRFTPELMNAALQHIQPEQWRGLFEHLLFDLRVNRSGMPDLFLWREHQYQFVEVKGPGDRLQPHQVRWLEKLTQLDIPASVCYLQADQPAS